MSYCKYCGEQIKVNFGKQTNFCSDKCRKAYHYRYGRMNKKCAVCGKEITGRQRRYCSPECARKSKAELEKEYKSIYNTKPQAEVKEEPKKEPTFSVEDICKLARAENSSYGKIVAKYGLY